MLSTFAVVLLTFAEIKAPAEVKTPCNRLARIEVSSTGKNTILIQPRGDCDAFQEVGPSGKLSFRVICYKPGKYYLHFVTVEGDVPVTATTEIIASDENAPIPPPAPTPGPVPTPPTPTPTPPVSEWEATLRAIYGADQNANKYTHRGYLAAALRQAAKLCNDQTLKTADQLYTGIKSIQTGIPNDSLQALRAAVSDKLAASLPEEPDALLTPAIRSATEDLLTRSAAILEAIK